MNSEVVKKAWGGAFVWGVVKRMLWDRGRGRLVPPSCLCSSRDFCIVYCEDFSCPRGPTSKTISLLHEVWNFAINCVLLCLVWHNYVVSTWTEWRQERRQYCTRWVKERTGQIIIFPIQTSENCCGWNDNKCDGDWCYVEGSHCTAQGLPQVWIRSYEKTFKIMINMSAQNQKGFILIVQKNCVIIYGVISFHILTYGPKFMGQP
jgi:hypothetical protein